MAKSPLQNKLTSEHHHRWGEYYYGLAADMEDQDAPQSKIDASWKMAAMEFWFALTLGSEKAPLSLFKCFRQGVGVEKDPYMRDLMYGAALQLTPQDCADKVKPENKPIIAKSMQPKIDALVKLVKQTRDQLPVEGVDVKVFNEQLTKFNHAIKLPSGKSLQSCFIEKSAKATSKEKDLKSKALELTKNLSNQNKPITTTMNHVPRKATKSSSRIGCIIS
ncbi:hypothetical protein [Candidatus Tisiphia endosymbiont of Thecophora atra]|uniref:hypothetical protein n=1 Tax=Candidatus Tisiphia endosymbiont of Thecophora atra TaxID=3066258 RepID=UPI00312C8658